MKHKPLKYSLWMLIVLIIICTSGCSIQNADSSTAQNQSNPIAPIDSEENPNLLPEGVYRYDEENDTKILEEDHYIVLEIRDGELMGRYYGTTDDFDEVREGYYQGFYVSQMKDLKIEKNRITFYIMLEETDLFSNPVDLQVICSNEVKKEENPQWVNAHIISTSEKNPMDYKGEIIDGSIVLNVEEGKRIFKKIEE